ncbi:AraC family transcriptional regulator ligand-binding domain-containing protein [Gordonia sp. ABSL1-1]|uniref:helix-turn-helix domain-containing protein n=1 Tax=Gordonia sp. ABSL1-1 TaxID=3053923 RepID=UPI002572EEBB|nr:AraC family transcriptional regulator [Gordonia sp. ABSL1-1]MDL9935545.1 AraC family transcriptional regulator ligand-binding domain-containing protein [Gordonia sp. ABSL1-1]
MAERRLLASTGLLLADLEDDDLEVEAVQELSVAQNLVQALGDRPGLGTEVAMRFTLANWGLLGFAMLSSPTAGEALQVALRTLQIGNRFIDITAGFTQTSARIAFQHKHLPADVRDFLLERDIAIIFGVIVLRCLSPQLVDRLGDSRLELALPGDRAAKLVDGMTAMLADLAHDPMQQFRIIADRPATELTFPLDLLAEPMAMPDPATAALCEQQCLDLLQNRLDRGRLATRIRAILLHEIRDAPTASEIADRLNMDRRTLARRLAEEGTNFRTLQEETRATLAIDMLGVLDLTVKETAARLGYASSEAFSRSFTRWTGSSPSAYRSRPRPPAAGHR